MKVFWAYLIMMGIIRKPKLEDYWSDDDCMVTPFFKKYMSRNRFQFILSNIHMRNENIPAADKKRDKLYKLRPLLSMLDRNFKKYKPEKAISLDEGGCPFKGRLAFKTYNPAKPNRFAIKTYQVCEATSGYCVAFDVYTAEERQWTIDTVAQDAGITTHTVLDTLHKADCLGQGYHVYMDNYYNSPELCQELLAKKTLVCGTLKPNRSGLPKEITRNIKKMNRKVNRGKCLWRRKNEMLCLLWMDKRTVLTISTIHSAKMVNVKVNYKGDTVKKPQPILMYTKYMFGVDLSDQLLAYYSLLRKSIKWWRKLMIHLVNLAMLNAYILYRKANTGHKGSHIAFRINLVRALIEDGLPTCTDTPAQVTPRRAVDPTRKHLVERHFPAVLQPKMNAKKAKPYRKCHLCKTKNTKFWCPDCQIPFCAAPCFGTYHTKADQVEEEDLEQDDPDDIEEFADLARPLDNAQNEEHDQDLSLDFDDVHNVTLTDLNVSEIEKALNGSGTLP